MRMVALHTQDGIIVVNPTQISTMDSFANDSICVILVDGRMYHVPVPYNSTRHRLMSSMTEEVNKALSS